MFVRLARLAVIPIIVAAGVLPVLSGCTQQFFTYSNQSREEGMRLYKDKAYSDAAGAFANAVRQDPRDYHSHYYLAVCYDQMNQHQQAFSQYRTGLEVLKQNRMQSLEVDFYETIMDSLASSIARYDSGDVELNNLENRAKDSHSSEDWFILAKIYRQKGDADRAIDAYKRAARWNSADYHPRKELGLYLLEPLNQTQDAEYWLRQAYHLEPNDNDLNAGLERLGITPAPAYNARNSSLRGTGPHTPAREPELQKAEAPSSTEADANRTASTPRD